MMARKGDLDGKTVVVIGGSTGLGKEMSKVMAARGAHITIISRSQTRLDEAKIEISAARLGESQEITTVEGDMGIPSKAHSVLSTQPRIPNILLCVAGGTPNECGFLLDLEPEIFERCMTNNYYSSLYPTQAVLKRWTEDDAAALKTTPTTAPPPTSPTKRKIIFVNSSASLCPIPGYVAYSAAKAAQRSLADTLRLEAMRHSNPRSHYIVQCVFAHNFITPTFLQEQKTKPALCKRIEGTDASTLLELEKQFPYAEKIAPEIVDAMLGGDDFAVLDKRLEPQIVWANMMGTSPRRGWGVWMGCWRL